MRLTKARTEKQKKEEKRTSKPNRHLFRKSGKLFGRHFLLLFLKFGRKFKNDAEWKPRESRTHTLSFLLDVNICLGSGKKMQNEVFLSFTVMGDESILMRAPLMSFNSHPKSHSLKAEKNARVQDELCKTL